MTKSTDPFVVVKNCSEVLDAAGFKKLSKREPFGGKLVQGEFKEVFFGGHGDSLFDDDVHCVMLMTLALNLFLALLSSLDKKHDRR